MLGQALDYHETINAFVSRNKDLHAPKLSNTDWESIDLVALWLKSFRSVTMEMLATKVPMLSTTHMIFWGLQDEIKKILRKLSNSVSPKIKLNLMNAHWKLSDYYYQFDVSPFNTWAACMWIIVSLNTLWCYSTTSAGPRDLLWGHEGRLCRWLNSFWSPQTIKIWPCWLF